MQGVVVARAQAALLYGAVFGHVIGLIILFLA